MEEKILNMFFIDRKKQIDIAKELNVSKYKVSRVVTKDSRYKEEKEYRKIINKKKHIEDTKKYIKKSRKIKSNEKIDDYAILKALHNQASRELSGAGNTINNREYKKWNSSAYKYDSRSKSYVLRKDIVTGADAPKRIKWTIN